MAETLHTREELDALRQQVADTLDLAIVKRAPFATIEKLACATGLLGALLELPSHALVASAVERGREALRAFRAWDRRAPRRAAA